MTPAASWSPDDYYRASRAARAAWERTDQQLSILSDCPALALMGGGLDETDAGSPPGSSVSSSPPNRLSASRHTSLGGTAGSLPPHEGGTP